MKALFELEDVEQFTDAVAEKVYARISSVLLTMHNQIDDVVDTDEIAEFLKVKTAQIYAWVNESKCSDNGIPFSKAGKFLRFSKKEVLEWMKTNREVLQKI
jgi:excisionase family DNA binding protein